jgi:hypothetical protein
VNSKLQPTRETAVVEELSPHLDDCCAKLLASGATPAEAYQQTLAELSGRELRRANCDVSSDRSNKSQSFSERIGEPI